MKTGDSFIHAGVRYEINESLGEGGYATAYRGKQFRLGNNYSPVDVVLKIPSAFVQNELGLRHRFVREARLLANVNHPHVVKTLGLYEGEDGNVAMIQELVRGAKHLDEYTADRDYDLPNLYLQALYALRAIHFRTTPSIVHRDVSPWNLLVDEHGRLKLIDFGLAFENPRQTQQFTRIGQALGTVGCDAPELHDDPTTVDHRADIFSLGKSFAAAAGRVKPAYARIDRLPDLWRHICERCCEHDRDRRYQNADEAIDDLLTIAGHAAMFGGYYYHIEEHKAPGVRIPKVWPAVVTGYLCGHAPLQLWELKLTAEVPAHQLDPIQAPKLFLQFEQSAALREVNAGRVGYEVGDDVAITYANLYPYLDSTCRVRCFAQIVRTAVALHRFNAMDIARVIYTGESDPFIRAGLDNVLNSSDPNRIVERGNAFPGRAPIIR